MKKILLLIGFAMALCVTAKAQTPIYAPQTLGTFTNVLSGATNVGYVVDCRKQASFCLQSTIICDGTNASTLNGWGTYSVDGTRYESTGRFFSLNCGGTTATSTITNIPTFGAGYFKINYITNGNGTVNATNVLLQYAIKINAP